MNAGPDQNRSATERATTDVRPILLIPYMWIGDFVRCHSVVRLLKARWPDRPVDLLATELNAPLAEYMPGVRKAVPGDLPRRRLAAARNWELAKRLRAEAYGTALIMSRKWKAALAPFLAGIPERIGFVGEARFVLLSEVRWGERKLPRMVDQCAALALPDGAPWPPEWPRPELRVPQAEVASWRARRSLAEDGRPVVALAPGAVGPSKRWPAESYAELARQLSHQGFAVWILGGPGESQVAAAIANGAGPNARDLTGHDLRDAILALAAADAAVSNDSGLLHVAAAIGTPTIGIFGPTNPRLWAPLNPLAATIETSTDVPCRPCHKPVCQVRHHRCMGDIPAGQVMDAVARALARTDLAVAT
jgi:lipopolysaccharide heptosyltransferase II